MLIHAEVFLLVMFGCLATNIDNILLVLASARQGGGRKSALVFLAVLTTAVLLGFVISLGVDLAIPRSVAWVGLVPLTMGIYELTPLHRAVSEPSTAPLSALGLALPLAANSLDTVLVQAVLFSDLATGYHLSGLAGAAAAAGLLTLLASKVISSPAFSERVLPLASKARPWLLVAVGGLILADLPFDVV